jgi:hypothetical protein
MSWLTQIYYEQNIKKHLMYRSFSDRYGEHSLLIKKPPSIVDPLAKRFSKTSLNIVQNVGRRQTINDVLNVYFPPANNIFWKDV